MSWLTGLSDALQGIPLNAVLRVRVALAEQRFKALEDENTALEAQVAALTAENEALRQKVEQAPVAAIPTKEPPEILYGLYYFGGDTSKLYCPRCYETHGKKHIMADVRHLGHKCTVCGNFIPR
jgi:hypothetical protein